MEMYTFPRKCVFQKIFDNLFNTFHKSARHCIHFLGIVCNVLILDISGSIQGVHLKTSHPLFLSPYGKSKKIQKHGKFIFEGDIP